MIWHIFKKDLRLMWRYAAGLAALHFALMVALLRIGRFRSTPEFFGINGSGVAYADHTLHVLSNVSLLLTYLVSAFLITAIVQQDAIPGVRQDWLVRPIRRRDLLLAKLLGVLLMVLAPIFAADLSGALLNGFPLGQSMDAAVGRSLWLWFGYFLAVFALASLTKNLMEAIVAGIALVAGVYFMPQLWMSFAPPAFFFNGRVEWIEQAVRIGILFAAAAALLGLQYFFRRTFIARLLVVGVVLIFLLVPAVPWQTAFALEQRLSSNPAAGNGVSVAFVPGRETLRDGPVGPLPYDRGDASVMLPIRVAGVPDGAILFSQTSTVRVFTSDGQTRMNEGPILNLGYQMGITIRKEEPGEGEKPINYVIRVPRSIYARIADQSVRVDID